MILLLFWWLLSWLNHQDVKSIYETKNKIVTKTGGGGGSVSIVV